MWGIRVLSGNQAGQIIPLKSGRNVLGRAPHCDIRIQSNGVSKEHAEINVYKDKIIISDLSSRNGTFVNGVRVQSSLVRIGDKISLHDILCDIMPVASQTLPQVHAHHPGVPQNYPAAGGPSGYPYPDQGSYAYGSSPDSENSGQVGPQRQGPPEIIQAIKDRLRYYLDEVAMPGIYRLTSTIEFPVLLGAFLSAFVLAVTILATIPMSRISSESILQESRRRAMSLARALSNINETAIHRGQESALSVQSARIEEGVLEAYIVSNSDGTIMAPAEMAGRAPGHGFIATARRESRETFNHIDSSTIGVTVPISSYNPDTATYSVRAHAVIVYDVGSISMDQGRLFSLFLQVLLIAGIIGALLYFVLLRVFAYPFEVLNRELDMALREKRDQTDLDFKFTPTQSLLSNINSLLARSLNPAEEEYGLPTVGLEQIAENTIQLIGYPALAVGADFQVYSANAGFEMLTGASLALIQGQNISSLPDASLHQNIGGLIDRAAQNPALVASDELSFGGENFMLSCQAVVNTKGEPQYYLITISPLAEEEGGAA